MPQLVRAQLRRNPIQLLSLRPDFGIKPPSCWSHRASSERQIQGASRQSRGGHDSGREGQAPGHGRRAQTGMEKRR
eukprot:3548173-Rhodomonas_salina.1